MLAHRITSHKAVDARCSVQYCLHVGAGRLMVVEVIAQPLCLFVKIFHEPVDVVFITASVQATLVKRGIERRTEMIGLLLNLFQYSFHLAISDTIRNAAYRCSDRRNRNPLIAITTPTPTHVISSSQLVEIALQRGPIVLSF